MQEDPAVVRKEMSLRRTFCLQFAIVILVQQMISVCSDECTCRCNRKEICDEINRLKTSDDFYDGQWKTWNVSLRYFDSLRRDFENQDWTHRVTEVEKEVKNIEDLKGRLMKAESLATRLETALKKDKKEFEIKLAEFERKLQDVQSQAVTLERNVIETVKKNQVDVPNIEAAMRLVEEQAKSFEHTIAAEKEARNQMQMNISRIEVRLRGVENQTNSFDPAIEAEKRAREEMREQLLQNVSRKHSEAESQFEELKNNLQSQLLEVKNETNDLKSDKENEKEFRIKFQEQLIQNFSMKHSEAESQFEELKNDLQSQLLGRGGNETNDLKSVIGNENEFRIKFQEKIEAFSDMMSTFAMKDREFQDAISDLEERLETVRNQTDNLEHAIKVEKQAREELEREKRSTIIPPTEESHISRGGEIQPVIRCDPPKNIENGHAIALSFEYGSELEYKCDKGFSLNTNETIYCTEKGIWSKTDVACIESCSIPHVSNGDMGKTIQEGPYRRKVFKQMNVGERVEDYEELVIRCFKGFEAADSGYQDVQIICGKGKWTPEPICNPAPCRSTAPFAANAEVVEVNRIHGGTVSYECLPDYKKRTEETVTCVNGEWLGETPSCESTQCSVDTLTSPGLQKGHKVFYRDGEVFEVTCNQNYRLDTENSGRIMCKDGTWTGHLTPCVRELFYEPCGTNRIGRDTRNMPSVITNATEGTWPWMANIHTKRRDGVFTHHCTGFLIDKKHVVSAANWFDHKDPDLYGAQLGSVDREAGKIYTITRIVFPRGQTGYSDYDDIAILTLSRDVGIPNFDPVCLPDNPIINMNLVGAGTTAVGWVGGDRRFLKQLSGMHVRSNEECGTLIRESPRQYPRGLTSDIFCATSENLNTCLFDLGSPLMLLYRNRWYAVGIRSSSLTCNPSSSTVVYTMVTSYLDWIRENARD